MVQATKETPAPARVENPLPSRPRSGARVNVNIARVFEGPRHERLRFLWDVIAEYQQDKFALRWFPNPDVMNHESVLKAMWAAELRRPERFALLTEADFLPRLWAWLPTDLLTREYPVLGARYVVRNANTRKLEGHNFVGPWYLLIDKERVQDLHFEAWGPFHDPANGLDHFMQQDYPGTAVRFLQYEDAYPLHYGTRMHVGDHLFWSSHLYHPKNMRISGVTMGDMQRAHDEFVVSWARAQPSGYRSILRKRLRASKANVGGADARASAPSVLETNR